MWEPLWSSSTGADTQIYVWQGLEYCYCCRFMIHKPQCSPSTIHSNSKKKNVWSDQSIFNQGALRISIDNWRFCPIDRVDNGNWGHWWVVEFNVSFFRWQEHNRRRLWKINSFTHSFEMSNEWRHTSDGTLLFRTCSSIHCPMIYEKTFDNRPTAACLSAFPLTQYWIDKSTE